MSRMISRLLRRGNRSEFPRRDRLPLSMLELESRAMLSASPWGPDAPQWARLSASGITQLASVSASPTGAAPNLDLSSFEPVAIDRATITGRLAEAPWGLSLETVLNPITLTLPKPDGTTARFSVWEVTTMEPGLAAEFPDIHTYRGQGLDDPTATLAADITPQGFHASILSPNATWFIDPYYHLDESVYAVYDPAFQTAQVGECLTPDDDDADPGSVTANKTVGKTAGKDDGDGGAPSLTSNGINLHTYRLAVAATGEYTTYHGGTVALAQAAIVTAVNRINQMYENEFAIHFDLVANNSSLVYTNASTDPYTNGSSGPMRAENQTTIDSVIGSANYDIGHVFGTASGGFNGTASLNVVGISGLKARGASDHSNPVGDFFSLKLVCHEIGHQFGAGHTWNGTNGGVLTNDQYMPASAYEPGNGSTIMSYGGNDGTSNDYAPTHYNFHFASLDQVTNYVASIPSVGTSTFLGVFQPTAHAGPDYTIPASTPFLLTGTADSATTFSWEQYDLGARRAIGDADNGSSPLFRSYLPDANLTRSFPRLSTVLSGALGTGDETAATTTRNLTFNFIVRNNHAGGGAYDSDRTVIHTVNTGSGFGITDLNAATTIQGGVGYLLHWNVAGTTGSGINTSLVNIDFSSDGGQTFTTLNPETPNDGSQLVYPPNMNTSVARFRIRAVGNIYYDINNADITVTQTPSVLTVTNTNDSGPGSLRQAVLDSNFYGGFQSIIFAPLFNTPQTITLTSGELQFTDSTTINGPGADKLTISGNSASRIFNLSGSPAASNFGFYGLQLRNASTGSMGGAIVIGDENLNLYNCYLHDNSSPNLGGGAIAVIAGGNLYLESSTLSGNSASYGGAISFYNGGGTLWLEQSTVSGNTAAGNGGGIYFSVAPNIRNITVRASTITGNVGFVGGGIYVGTGNVPITAITSIISGNVATTGLASDIRSIYTAAPQVTAIRSALGNVQGMSIAGSDNLPIAIDLQLKPLAMNGGPMPTVAMAVTSPVVNSGYNPSFTSWDGRGQGFPRAVGQPDIGAFELGAYSAPVDNIGDLDDGNYSPGQFTLREAVAFANISTNTTETITFSPLFNTPQTIALTKELQIIDGVTINGPGADKLTISGNGASRGFNTSGAPAGAEITLSGLQIANAYTTSMGAGVVIGDEVLTLNNCWIRNSTSTSLGGGAIASIAGGRVNLNGSTLSGNVAAYGGAVSFYNGGGRFIMSNSTISGNSTSGNGGALYFSQNPGVASIIINNSTLSGNTALRGGGVYVGVGNVPILATSSVISGNVATSGTGPDIRSPFTQSPQVYADYSNIGDTVGFNINGSGNLFGSNMGLAPLAFNGGPVPTMLPATTSLLRDRGSNPDLLPYDSRGPGFSRVYNAQADIGAVELPPDFAVRNADSNGPGSFSAQIADANAVVGANVITFDPGFFTANAPRTITLATELPITDALTVNGPGANVLTLSGNSASRIFNINAPGTFTPVALRGLTIANGSAADGGGILLSDDELTLTEVTLRNNTATAFDGGGVYVSGGGRLIVADSTFHSNKAQYGGAIDFYNGGGGSLTLTNSTLSGNTATTGGAIYFEGSAGAGIAIRNSTLTANSASSGGAVFRAGNALTPFTVDSTIVSGNTFTSEGEISSSGTLTANRNAFGTAAGFTYTGADNLVGAVLNLGPLQINSGTTPTHALGAGSAAINAGSNPAGLAFDQRGSTRSVGVTDIGAYEIQPAPTAIISVNQGAVQRSRITRIDVTFNTVVTLAPNAISLNGPASPVVSLTTGVVNGATVATLTFSGPGTDSGSLKDGIWTLTVGGFAVTNADGVAMGANTAKTFKRLFGDGDGNGTVDATDFSFFPAFGNVSNSPFDFNDNGDIDSATDFAQFGNRFGVTL